MVGNKSQRFLIGHGKTYISLMKINNINNTLSTTYITLSSLFVGFFCRYVIWEIFLYTVSFLNVKMLRNCSTFMTCLNFQPILTLLCFSSKTSLS